MSLIFARPPGPGCRSRAPRSTAAARAPPRATAARCRAPPPRRRPARNASSPRKPRGELRAHRACARRGPRTRRRRNSALDAGVPDLEGGVPGGEHREVLVIEVVDRAGVVLAELLLGDVVHPGLDHLGEQPTGGPRGPSTRPSTRIASAGSMKQSIMSAHHRKPGLTERAQHGDARQICRAWPSPLT